MPHIQAVLWEKNADAAPEISIWSVPGDVAGLVSLGISSPLEKSAVVRWRTPYLFTLSDKIVVRQTLYLGSTAVVC